MRDLTNSYATNGTISVSSNFRENLDFSFNYSGNYTIVKNSLQKQSNSNYFTHNATFKINWIFLKRTVFNTEVTHNSYKGLSQNFNQQYFLWNAAIGNKFFRNRSLEARVSVFDLLNQNRRISRTVNGSYTEDSKTMVLRRYGMFTLIYTLKNFMSFEETDKAPDSK